MGRAEAGSESGGEKSRYMWAGLYTSRMPVTAVQILKNHVLPFFEEQGVKVETVLSDNGREFCGREDQHPYELFLQLEEMPHRRTQVGRPQSNGYSERLHCTLLDEHLRVKGRTTWYESVSEMQEDLDAYIETYIGTVRTAAAAWRGGRRTRCSRRGSGSPGPGRSQPRRRRRPQPEALTSARPGVR